VRGQAKPDDNTLLEMAIVGYQRELGRISAKIADIKQRLGQRQWIMRARRSAAR
jgi:hypothetical protein